MLRPSLPPKPALALILQGLALFLLLALTVDAWADPWRPDRLEAFFDGTIRAQMRTHKIPGAAAVVVRDGEVILARGWGLADLERGTAFSAETSSFKTGSFTKVFTDAALMQLWERGQVDLGADVNTYLKGFRVPDDFPEPVRVRHLLTHTAGFELRLDGLLAPGYDQIKPLSRWLAENRRARVRPPGKLAAYTNYAQVMAGYLVECVSGEPYQDYLEQNLLVPLEMTRSSIRQPVPKDLENDLVVGNMVKGGRYEPLEPEPVHIVPAAALTASTLDLSRFLTAMMQGGRYHDQQILKETTVAEMLKPQFSHDPRLSGASYGFYGTRTHGQRVLLHRGYMSGVSCLMALIPEQKTGFVVVYNCETAYWARYDILALFMDNFFPCPVPEAKRPGSPRPELKRFGGYYLPTSAQGATFQNILTPLYALGLRTTPEGTLLTSWDRRAKPQEFVEVEPLVFQERGGFDRMIFHQGEKGRIDRMSLDHQPSIAFIPLAWFETPPFHLGFLAVSCLLFVLYLVFWQIGLWRGRQRGLAGEARAALWLAGGATGVYLLTLMGLLIGLIDLHKFAYGITPFLAGVLKLPYLGGVLALAALATLPLAWIRNWWRLRMRILYSLTALCLGLFTLWLVYWKMI